jgi:hypothetical protein
LAASSDDAEEAIPASEAGLQKKRLEQRQRMLQRHRAGSSLISSTDTLGNGAPSTSSWSGLALDQGGYQPLLDVSRAVPSQALGMSNARPIMLDSSNLSLSSMAMGDKDLSAIIMPEMVYADRKEEDEARRRCLAQELDERGICPVYDPVPPTGGSYKELNFDISNIKPEDIKSFLLSPSPKHAGMIECRIVRERSGANKFFPRYIMESDAGTFLLSAKKQKKNRTSNYWITMTQADVGKDSDAFLGKLRSNLFGLEFTCYGTGLNPKKIDPTMPQVHAIQLARQEMAAVQYSSSLWGSKPRGPRKMCAVIPRVQPNGERLVCRTVKPQTEGLNALQKAGTASNLVESYHNKPPKWNDQIGAFVLNFNKRVTQASVKNFQLTNNDDPDTVYLQFGRVGKDVFNMDFRYPFSPFQAFAICLSSFDYKLCCE